MMGRRRKSSLGETSGTQAKTEKKTPKRTYKRREPKTPVNFAEALLPRRSMRAQRIPPEEIECPNNNARASTSSKARRAVGIDHSQEDMVSDMDDLEHDPNYEVGRENSNMEGTDESGPYNAEGEQYADGMEIVAEVELSSETGALALIPHNPYGQRQLPNGIYGTQVIVTNSQLPLMITSCTEENLLLGRYSFPDIFYSHPDQLSGAYVGINHTDLIQVFQAGERGEMWRSLVSQHNLLDMATSNYNNEQQLNERVATLTECVKKTVYMRTIVEKEFTKLQAAFGPLERENQILQKQVTALIGERDILITEHKAELQASKQRRFHEQGYNDAVDEVKGQREKKIKILELTLKSTKKDLDLQNNKMKKIQIEIKRNVIELLKKEGVLTHKICRRSSTLLRCLLLHLKEFNNVEATKTGRILDFIDEKLKEIPQPEMNDEMKTVLDDIIRLTDSGTCGEMDWEKLYKLFRDATIAQDSESRKSILKKISECIMERCPEDSDGEMERLIENAAENDSDEEDERTKPNSSRPLLHLDPKFDKFKSPLNPFINTLTPKLIVSKNVSRIVHTPKPKPQTRSKSVPTGGAANKKTRKSAAKTTTPGTVKRGRGRPKKNPVQPNPDDSDFANGEAGGSELGTLNPALENYIKGKPSQKPKKIKSRIARPRNTESSTSESSDNESDPEWPRSNPTKSKPQARKSRGRKEQNSDDEHDGVIPFVPITPKRFANKGPSPVPFGEQLMQSLGPMENWNLDEELPLPKAKVSGSGIPKQKETSDPSPDSTMETLRDDLDLSDSEDEENPETTSTMDKLENPSPSESKTPSKPKTDVQEDVKPKDDETLEEGQLETEDDEELVEIEAGVKAKSRSKSNKGRKTPVPRKSGRPSRSRSAKKSNNKKEDVPVPGFGVTEKQLVEIATSIEESAASAQSAKKRKSAAAKKKEAKETANKQPEVEPPTEVESMDVSTGSGGEEPEVVVKTIRRSLRTPTPHQQTTRSHTPLVVAVAKPDIGKNTPAVETPDNRRKSVKDRLGDPTLIIAVGGKGNRCQKLRLEEQVDNAKSRRGKPNPKETNEKTQGSSRSTALTQEISTQELVETKEDKEEEAKGNPKEGKGKKKDMKIGGTNATNKNKTTKDETKASKGGKYKQLNKSTTPSTPANAKKSTARPTRKTPHIRDQIRKSVLRGKLDISTLSPSPLPKKPKKSLPQTLQSQPEEPSSPKKKTKFPKLKPSVAKDGKPNKRATRKRKRSTDKSDEPPPPKLVAVGINLPTPTPPETPNTTQNPTPQKQQQQAMPMLTPYTGMSNEVSKHIAGTTMPIPPRPSPRKVLTAKTPARAAMKKRGNKTQEMESTTAILIEPMVESESNNNIQQIVPYQNGNMEHQNGNLPQQQPYPLAQQQNPLAQQQNLPQQQQNPLAQQQNLPQQQQNPLQQQQFMNQLMAFAQMMNAFNSFSTMYGPNNFMPGQPPYVDPNSPATQGTQPNIQGGGYQNPNIPGQIPPPPFNPMMNNPVFPPQMFMMPMPPVMNNNTMPAQGISNPTPPVAPTITTTQNTDSDTQTEEVAKEKKSRKRPTSTPTKKRPQRIVRKQKPKAAGAPGVKCWSSGTTTEAVKTPAHSSQPSTSTKTNTNSEADDEAEMDRSNSSELFIDVGNETEAMPGPSSVDSSNRTGAKVVMHVEASHDAICTGFQRYKAGRVEHFLDSKSGSLVSGLGIKGPQLSESEDDESGCDSGTCSRSPKSDDDTPMMERTLLPLFDTPESPSSSPLPGDHNAVAIANSNFQESYKWRPAAKNLMDHIHLNSMEELRMFERVKENLHILIRDNALPCKLMARALHLVVNKTDGGAELIRPTEDDPPLREVDHKVLIFIQNLMTHEPQRYGTLANDVIDFFYLVVLPDRKFIHPLTKDHAGLNKLGRFYGVLCQRFSNSTMVKTILYTCMLSRPDISTTIAHGMLCSFSECFSMLPDEFNYEKIEPREKLMLFILQHPMTQKLKFTMELRSLLTQSLRHPRFECTWDQMLTDTLNILRGTESQAQITNTVEGLILLFIHGGWAWLSTYLGRNLPELIREWSTGDLPTSTLGALLDALGKACKSTREAWNIAQLINDVGHIEDLGKINGMVDAELHKSIDLCLANLIETRERNKKAVVPYRNNSPGQNHNYGNGRGGPYGRGKGNPNGNGGKPWRKKNKKKKQGKILPKKK